MDAVHRLLAGGRPQVRTARGEEADEEAQVVEGHQSLGVDSTGAWAMGMLGDGKTQLIPPRHKEGPVDCAPQPWPSLGQSALVSSFSPSPQCGICLAQLS